MQLRFAFAEDCSIDLPTFDAGTGRPVPNSKNNQEPLWRDEARAARRQGEKSRAGIGPAFYFASLLGICTSRVWPALQRMPWTTTFCHEGLVQASLPWPRAQ